MDEDFLFIIDTMTWSFSRLNSFYNCPYEWKSVYMDCSDKENGFFGEYGGYCHKILEKYLKGELSLFELSQYYEEHFNEEIPHDAPSNKYIDIRQSYYDKGLDYFNNFDFDINKYEILGIEKEVKFKIMDKDFIGFIDLLVQDKETGEVIIIDHKSASIKILKNGNISKSDKEHFDAFRRQLQLYSIPIIKEYGRVDKLSWNMFKDQNWITIPWTKEDNEEAINWAKDTIKLIEKEKDFPPNPDFYYCWNLCSQRNSCCPYKPQPISKKEFNPETDE